MGEGPWDALQGPWDCRLAPRRSAFAVPCSGALYFVLLQTGTGARPECVRACSRRPAPARGWVVVAGALACRHRLCFHPIGVPVRWTLCALSLQCHASVVDPTVCA